MNLNSINKLSKEKKKITILFTFSIFFIVIILELSFLGYKYFDYRNQEFQRLNFQTDALSNGIKENPLFEELIFEGKNLFDDELAPQAPSRNRNTQRKIRIQNFFLYDNSTLRILFSPIKDNILYGEILSKALQSNNNSFSYNSLEYFFVNKKINENISIISFVESRLTMADFLKELGEYLFFAILLSFLIYFISFRFVSRTLKPVEENLDDMEQFIHNAGHELKTPISVIKSSLQLAKLKKNYKESVEESLGELDKMNNLIQALISLSTISENIENKIINVNEFIKKIIKNYEIILEQKTLKIELIENEILEINTNGEYFEIFFSNLMSNAIKYNKVLGGIKITINKNGLEISNTGEGINKENLGKIFDRFYQESDSREENSFGIGLSLVKKIADIYNWKITVESQKGIETKFIINF
ncbi:HAMP domain-containing histidine kinase [Candidatus Gracilibacteria bacterium]|nr:HAMP domain-containing histidine kinase [Candidatus Gracilibacteria bacterium]